MRKKVIRYGLRKKYRQIDIYIVIFLPKIILRNVANNLKRLNKKSVASIMERRSVCIPTNQEVYIN